MEVVRSFRLLIIGILKRLYVLIPSIFSDPYDILERWFKVVIEVPTSIFWITFSICMLAVITLAYHEVRMESLQLKKALNGATVSAHTTQVLAPPKKRLDFRDRDALNEVVDYMERVHGHADRSTMESDMLKGVLAGNLLNGVCSRCGKPRKEQGDIIFG